MDPNRRAYPRLACDIPGVVEFLPRAKAAVGRRQHATAILHSISCEGASLLCSTPLQIDRDKLLNLHFAIDGNEFLLPATVVWSKPAGESLTLLGLQLMLALSDSANRVGFAEWITRKSINR